MTAKAPQKLSVLICTARREDFLKDLLIALDRAHIQDPVYDLEIVVIDNDSQKSAKVIVEQLEDQISIPVHYAHEPTPGVSSARNKAIALASHSFCLFIDDDQLIEPAFFTELRDTLHKIPETFSAVRLHVSWKFETDTPEWLKQGLSETQSEKITASRHCQPLHRREMGTGGLLINKDNLCSKESDAPLFDTTLNGAGGEDVAMFLKATESGKTFYYASTPSVIERVPTDRATAIYGLRSSFRKGFVDATLSLRDAGIAAKILYAAQTMSYVGVALILLPLSMLCGRLTIFNAAAKIARQLGKWKALGRGKNSHYGQKHEKTRVLHLTGGGHDGGAEKIIEQISIHTSPESADLSFFFYNSTGPRPFSAAINSRWENVRHHQKANGIDWTLWRKLIGLVRTEKIDVIHTHDIGAMLHANVARIFNPKVKLVHTEHTLHYWINSRKYRLLYYVLALGYSAIACVSAYVKREIASKVGVSEGKLKIVPNGVDIDAFAPDKISIQAGQPLQRTLSLVSVSRIDANKNIAQILRAIKQARTRGLDVTLTHLGGGSSEDVEFIHALSKKLGLTEHITFAGFQTTIAPWIAAADCFVSASKIECHPVSVLEALASGKPCLLSSIPPHQEVKNAMSNPGIILFDQQDDALADAIIKMYENFNGHRTSAYQSIQSARSFYSIPVMLAQYFSLYALK